MISELQAMMDEEGKTKYICIVGFLLLEISTENINILNDQIYHVPVKLNFAIFIS